MQFLKSPAAGLTGLVLCRGVVPAWVLAGAAFKLYERTPSNLPSMFVALAKETGLDLGQLLRTLIGLELLAVAVMVFVARLARPMALFMLGSFCAILVVELLRSATSCGCFGSIKVHPGVMLAIDGTLLALTAIFAPPRPEAAMPRRALASAAVAILAGFGLSFWLPERMAGDGLPPPPPNGNDNGGTPVHEGCTAPPQPIAAPAWWYVKAGETERWQGLCWNQIDLFQILRQYPGDLARGRKHVVFYRRDCEHCGKMFSDYFTGALEDPVIAYRIPSEALWEPPETTRVTFIDLPEKPELVIETPLIITLEDGKVVCAIEGEGFEKCLD